MYYMLRYCPQKEDLIDKVSLLIKDRDQGKAVKKNLHKYFKNVDSQGPLLVDQENGPHEYIQNVRQDVFDRFKVLREASWR